MNIQDWLDKRKIDNEEEENVSDMAHKLYENQRKAYNSIKGTLGLAEIVRYWKAEKQQCEDFFRGNSTDEKMTNRMRAKYEISSNFIMFIENLDKA